MQAGGLAPYPPFLWKCLYQVTGHCGFPSFRLLTDFVCLLTYEFCLSLWKIARCSVILLLPLFAIGLWKSSDSVVFFFLCFSFYYVHWFQRGCLCRLYVVRPVVLVVDELYILPKHLSLPPFLSGFESLVCFFFVNQCRSVWPFSLTYCVFFPSSIVW